MVKNDLTGKRFGNLTVLYDTGIRSKSGQVYWMCKCDCGNLTSVQGKHLKSGNIKVITKYLIENIYVNGAAFTGREVLEKLGRSNLSVVPLVNYFYKKYGNKNY